MRQYSEGIEEDDFIEQQYQHDKTIEECEMLMQLAEEKAQAAFNRWWKDEGSGMIPKPDDDMESHAKRIAWIAWMNGAFKAEER